MLILVTGGSRSGKSSHALILAGKLPGPRTYLATAQALDDEMRQRIAAHRRARSADWGLVEEPLLVPRALGSALTAAPTVVLDCVTIWMSNLLLADERFDESSAEARAEELVQSARSVPGATAILVTNEVGSGVVPETVLGRRFRDCAGRANEVIARSADEVYLMVSGIPLRIKPQDIKPQERKSNDG
jgi:adenosylcobinamide kinase/adenosylcobinamide-phosphate guanylyltransferase